ncbi:hypothetical protein NDU88_004368 [Pleurodeles waltl]|uniref:Uncharacterized protein n=1 Tax=Pleurodeles waltl TaxID=8319 RepID=A0AAV7WA55_PLEWA|nr:hypothetical protein NDU88_004368 [Pleurodeles waltl]
MWLHPGGVVRRNAEFCAGEPPTYLEGIATQRQNKNEGNLRHLVAKTPVKKQTPTQSGVADGGEAGSMTWRGRHHPNNEVFLEALIRVLLEDLDTLRQELAASVYELKGEVAELGQRVDIVEGTHNAQDEELDHHRQEILALQGSNLLQCYRALRPVTAMLQEREIRYKWGHLFQLQFVRQNEKHFIRTLEEAESLADMTLGQGGLALGIPNESGHTGGEGH